LVLKENTTALYDDVSLFLQDVQANNLGAIDSQCEETVDAEYGRLDIRTY
jgi:hypothetical protein